MSVFVELTRRINEWRNRWETRPFYDGELGTVFSVPGLVYDWRQDDDGNWYRHYTMIEEARVAELHEAGTPWQHYFHPSQDDPTVCEKCEGPEEGPGEETYLKPQPGIMTTPLSVTTKEQKVVLDTFIALLREVTADGGRKRAAGEKPPWWRDAAHMPAIFSHLNKWAHGEKRDPDSGAHPLVHLAWRALAIAYQETYGRVDPEYRLPGVGRESRVP